MKMNTEQMNVRMLININRQKVIIRILNENEHKAGDNEDVK